MKIILALIFLIVLFSGLTGCAVTGTPTTQPSVQSAQAAIDAFGQQNAIIWPVIVAEHNAGNIGDSDFQKYQAAETGITNLIAKYQLRVNAGETLTAADIVTAIEPTLLELAIPHAKIVKPK